MPDQPFVLVVEDEPVTRMLTKRILTAHHVPHAMAVSGRDALAKAATHRPDLILMDLSLPDIDGWEVTRRIRIDPALAGIRILAVSGDAVVTDRRQILRAGFDGSLAKPYRAADLLAAVEETEVAPLSAAAVVGAA